MPVDRTDSPLTAPVLQNMKERLEEARHFHLDRLAEGENSDADDIRMAMARRSETALEETEAALGRIDAGTYGRCEPCGNQINVERLEAIPHTAVCVNCVSNR